VSRWMLVSGAAAVVVSVGLNAYTWGFNAGREAWGPLATDCLGDLKRSSARMKQLSENFQCSSDRQSDQAARLCGCDEDQNWMAQWPNPDGGPLPLCNCLEYMPDKRARREACERRVFFELSDGGGWINGYGERP
jgi:hypothetical protein